MNTENTDELKKVIEDLEAEYPEHYPTKPVGGRNPYYKCIYCEKTDPQISIDRDNGTSGHYEHCDWVKGRKKIVSLKSLLEEIESKS